MWPVRLLALTLLLLALPSSAGAQSIVVMVNDEPITSYDVAQRQKFLALTSGLGDRMRNRMQSEETQEAFRAYMTENRPQSKEEAEALQKKFVSRIQQQVISGASKAMRKEAIDQLIDERLMIQAAKERKIDIAEDELDRALTTMAQRGGKASLKEFLASFKAQGVNPVTLRERIRAQLAWGQLIRGLYGPLVQSTVSAVGSTASSDESATIVDAYIVKLTASKGDQKALAGRLVEAEEIRKGFSSCSQLAAQLQGRSGVSVQKVTKAKLKDFSGDVRAALSKANEGDMTPPIVKNDAVETVALCSKQVLAAKTDDSNRDSGGGDERADKMQLYAERHLKDIKARAHLKYPKSG
ncbi:MAG: SurA N-terminal domain-containing protein [Rhodomicrobiaceae bacterium]